MCSGVQVFRCSRSSIRMFYCSNVLLFNLMFCKGIQALRNEGIEALSSCDAVIYPVKCEARTISLGCCAAVPDLPNLEESVRGKLRSVRDFAALKMQYGEKAC